MTEPFIAFLNTYSNIIKDKICEWKTIIKESKPNKNSLIESLEILYKHLQMNIVEVKFVKSPEEDNISNYTKNFSRVKVNI